MAKDLSDKKVALFHHEMQDFFKELYCVYPYLYKVNLLFGKTSGVIRIIL